MAPRRRDAATIGGYRGAMGWQDDTGQGRDAELAEFIRRLSAEQEAARQAAPGARAFRALQWGRFLLALLFVAWSLLGLLPQLFPGLGRGAPAVLIVIFAGLAWWHCRTRGTVPLSPRRTRPGAFEAEAARLTRRPPRP